MNETKKLHKNLWAYYKKLIVKARENGILPMQIVSCVTESSPTDAIDREITFLVHECSELQEKIRLSQINNWTNPDASFQVIIK